MSRPIKFTLKKDGKYFTAEYNSGAGAFKQGFWAPSLETCCGCPDRSIVEQWQKEHGGELVEYTRAFGRCCEVTPEQPPVARQLADGIYTALSELIRHLGGDPEFDQLRHRPYWDDAINALRSYQATAGVPHKEPIPDVSPAVSP